MSVTVIRARTPEALAQDINAAQEVAALASRALVLKQIIYAYGAPQGSRYVAFMEGYTP